MLVHLLVLSTALAAATTGKHDVYKDDVIWLKNNCEPWEDVINKWKSSFELRQLQQFETVGEFIKYWPTLNNTRSDVLIYLDFDALHPDRTNSFHLKWSDFMKKILEIKNTNCKDETKTLSEYIDRLADDGGVDVPEFGEPITNLTVAIGRDATFKCIVVNLGNYRVGWVKADTKAIQAIHEHVITHNPRVSVSHSDHSTWYLHIKSVQEEDRGQYMCQINTDPMKSQMGFLEVVIPPDFVPEETSGDTMVPEGGTARVACKARGVPLPRVTWKREDGQEIVVRDHTGSKSKVLTYQGDVLKLTKISRSEMGTYLCIATNGVPPSVSKRIHVSVHFHPVIQVPNQLVGAPLGTDVTLECYVESSPKSINYWVKDPGELIIPSEHHEMTVRQKSMFEAEMSMTIKNIRREDLGSYICVAKNSLGDVESKIRLYEIPGNDRHVYQYPDERIVPEEDYGTETYEDDDNDEKSNRVPDRANKWYANDGKVVPANDASNLPAYAISIFLTVVETLVL